ncbi:hypothetical protein QO001_005040 [Methylobacterium brachiatum]|uniref:Uncharacterized protein n=1 Tax=Methylobacterium brachiatum TaxID=269660 RepID=A0AAJ1TS09_9HYPH|nr:hypothetical protein [Methylobacterium brachiatum]MCB4805163.1 hypothetical protein [Methylobacterium brachiatum]MDQ0546091.1 hypothetical protein [Methylobacterium brachiatum]
MNRQGNDKHNRPRTELRIMLDPVDYADICSLAKVSGLAASQFSRQVLKRYLARIHAAGETKEQNT